MNISAVRRLLGLSLLLLCSVAVHSQERSIPHRQGTTVLPGVPQRVLVQDLATLDNLAALGVHVTGVPNFRMPAYLARYDSDRYIKIGTLQEPDFEAINAADADLMIVGPRGSGGHAQLSRMLPTIDLSADNLDLIDTVQANIATLGRIFDRPASARLLNAQLDARIERLRAEAQGAGRAIVLVTNAGRLGVYGPASRLSWVFSDAGFEQVMENVDDRFHGGDGVSFEFILEANPDWLLVVDRDAGVGTGEAGAAARLLDNPLIRQTTAWQKGQIVYMEPTSAYVVMHGYSALSKLIDQLHAALVASKQQR